MGLRKDDVTADPVAKHSDVDAVLRHPPSAVSRPLAFDALTFRLFMQHGTELRLRDADDGTSDLHETGFAILN